MARERLPQDLKLRIDLLPLTGLPSYLIRTFRDLSLDEIREDWRHVALNAMALTTYNLDIGLFADYLIGNYS